MYVDGIVITGNDEEITELKHHTFQHLHNKDFGRSRYFWGIEVAQSKSKIVFSQRKYALDNLGEKRMTDCSTFNFLRDSNVKLLLG